MLNDEGTLEEYLGLLIKQDDDDFFRASQSMLIERIIASIPGIKDAHREKSPAMSGAVLSKDEETETRKDLWNYRSVIEMLNYLVNYSHPKLAFAVQQYTRFCDTPKCYQEQSVKCILRCLIHTQKIGEQGMIFCLNKTKNIGTFVDASFAGKWNTAWSN